MRGLLAVATSFAVVTGLAGQAPETGTISGLVRLTARVRGAALPSNVYQPRAVSSHSGVAIPEIKNVVVYLTGITFDGVLPVSRDEIRQENESFVPHVLAVTRGSTVVFPNADPFFHNVFSLSSASTFDLGRYPMGRRKSTTFSRTGLVKVYCHIHSHMSASILVLDHPYFVIPDSDGSFRLPDVPRGKYTLVGWHERIGERMLDVEVRSGAVASVALSLPVEDAQ